MNASKLFSLVIAFCVISGSAQCEKDGISSLVRTWGFKAEGEFGMSGRRMSKLMRSVTAVSYESFSDKSGAPKLLRVKVEIRSESGFVVTMMMDLLGDTNKVVASLHGAIENSVATIAKELERYESVPLPTGALAVALDYNGRAFIGLKAQNSRGPDVETQIEKQLRENGEFFEAQSLALYSTLDGVLSLLPNQGKTTED